MDWSYGQSSYKGGKGDYGKADYGYNGYSKGGPSQDYGYSDGGKGDYGYHGYSSGGKSQDYSYKGGKDGGYGGYDSYNGGPPSAWDYGSKGGKSKDADYGYKGGKSYGGSDGWYEDSYNKGSYDRRPPLRGKGESKGKNFSGKGKSKGSSKGSSGKSSGNLKELEATAIQEIVDEILDESKEGRVWIANWPGRFQTHFGMLREFLESHPEKFEVIEGEGRRFTVAFAGGAAPQGRSGGKSRGKGDKKGDKKPQWKKAGTPAEGDAAGGGGKSKSDLEERAIKEIVDQLLDESREGRVWIANWPGRFQPQLGRLREFIEEHPEKFKVHPEEGSRFTVSFAGGASRIQ